MISPLDKISNKKQQLIDAKNASPLSVGEVISVKESTISYKKDSTKSVTCTIQSLDNNEIIVYEGSAKERKSYTTLHTIKPEDIKSRQLYWIGADPFDKNIDPVRPIAYTLESVLFGLDILKEKGQKYTHMDVPVFETNWNPFVYNKEGQKEFYQRPFVWSLKDNQLLIESIYQNIDCGKILIRKRSWAEFTKMVKAGETALYFNDIVDGKQRLNAIRAFIAEEFPDLNGNYYGDLSNHAQRKLTDNQLFSYSELQEDTDDSVVLRQFLKLNFSGVPQSEDHIEFVKQIVNKV